MSRNLHAEPERPAAAHGSPGASMWLPPGRGLTHASFICGLWSDHTQDRKTDSVPGGSHGETLCGESAGVLRGVGLRSRQSPGVGAARMNLAGSSPRTCQWDGGLQPPGVRDAGHGEVGGRHLGGSRRPPAPAVQPAGGAHGAHTLPRLRHQERPCL